MSSVSQLTAWVTRVMFTLCIGYTLHVPWKWLWASFQIVANFMVLYTHSISSSHWFAIYLLFSCMSTACSILQLNLYSKSYRDALLYNFYDFLSTEQKILMLGFNVQSSWALLSWLLITVLCGYSLVFSIPQIHRL